MKSMRDQVCQHLLLCLILSCAVIFAPAAQATSAIWNGSNSGTWSTSGNWDGSPATVPGTGDTATFTYNTGSATISLGTGLIINQIVFDAALVQSYTIGAGAANTQTLTLNNGGTIALTGTVNNNQTFNSAITLGTDMGTATYTFSNASTSSLLTFNGNITGASSGGTAGPKTLSAGGAGNITINGAITKGGASVLTFAKTGTGTVTLTGGGTISTLSMNGGILDLGAGNLTLSRGTGSGTAFSGSGGTVNASSGGKIILANDGGAGNYADWGTTGIVTINAVIDDGTGTYGIDFYGGGTYVLTAANTFKGSADLFGTTVNVGTIGNSGNASPLGKNGTILFGSGTTAGKLVYTGAGETSDKVIQLSGTTGGATIDQSGSGNLEFTSNLSYANGTGTRTLTLQGSTAGTGEISGIIGNQAAGTITAVTKAGTGTWTLSGLNTYTGATTLSAGTLNVTGTLGNTAITINGGTLNLQNASAVSQNTVTLTTGALNATVANAISGSAALTLNGGTATLSAANTYTGPTKFNAAYLILGNNNALGDTSSHTSEVSINGAGTLQASGSITIPGAIPFNFASNWTVSGANNIIAGGTFTQYGGNRTLTSSITGGNTLSITGNVNLSDTTTAHTLTIGGTGNTVISGIIQDGSGSTGGGLTKAGTGTVTLNGVNTYTGGTTVSAGILNLGTTTALGSTSGSLTINGGTVQVNALAINIGTFSGTGGVLNLGTGAVTTTFGGSQSYSGVIAGTGSLTMAGSGTLTLGTANTYAGKTYINSGILQISADAGLGAAPVGAVADQLSLSGGTLRLNNTFTLSTNRGVTLNAGGGTFDAQTGFTIQYSGVIAGTGSFTKTGAGTLDSRGTYSSSQPIYIRNGTFLTQKGGSGYLNGVTIYLGDGATANGATWLLSNNGGTFANPIQIVAGGTGVYKVASTGGGQTFTLSGLITLNNPGITLSTTTSNDALIFSGGVTGTGTLTLAANSAGNITLQTTAVNNTGPIINNGTSTGVVTISSGIGVNVTGVYQNSSTSTLVITGRGTYASGTTINAGTLSVNAGSGAITSGASPLGTSTFSNTVTINNGGVLSGTVNNWLDSTGASSGGANAHTIVVNQGGKLTSGGGGITGLGNITLNGGTLEIGNGYSNGTWFGSYTLMGDLTVSGSSPSYITLANGATPTSAGNMQMSSGGNGVGGTRSFIVNNVTGDSSPDLIISGSIISGTVNKSGLGTAKITAAQNPGTGTSGAATAQANWTVQAGTLNLAHALAVQYGTLTMSGGNLVFDSSVVGNSFTLGALVASSAGAGYDILLENNAGAGIGLNVGSNSANTTYAGALIGTGSLTKIGNGTLTLSGANIYTGDTTVNAGTLKGGAANVFGGTSSTSALVMGGGTLDMGGYNQTIGSMTGTGTITSSATGALTLTAGNDDTSPAAFTGAIKNGSATSIGLTKIGTGTLILAGNNTYTGATTLNGGTVVLGADQNLSGALNFGASNTDGSSTTASTLDLTNANATFSGVLTFWTNTGSANVVTIGSTKTLTVNNNVQFGPSLSSGTSAITAATFNGGGAFTVTGTAFTLGGTQSSRPDAVTVDMSALGTFTANLGATGTLRIGDAGTGAGPGSPDTLILAPTSTITAQYLKVGNDAGVFDANVLKLGTTANNLFVDSILLAGATVSGGYRGNAAVQFYNSNGMVLIRDHTATDSTSTTRASLDMVVGPTTTAAGLTATVDFTGHTADVRLSTLTMNNRTASGTVTANATSTFIFDTGTLDVLTAVIANKGGSNSGNSTATLTIGGGVANFGSIQMAGNSNGGTIGASQATLNLTGGVVTLAGDITKIGVTGGGTGTAGATINLNGAALYMAGYNIGDGINPIDNLIFASGTLDSVGAINGTGGLTKTTSGLLTLTGANAYTGLTDVQAGTLAFGADNVIADAASVRISGGALDIATRSDTVAGVQLTSGNITGASGVLTSTTDFDVQNGSVSAKLGGGVGLTKTTGNTVTLGGANTYTGTTTISGGTLALSSTGSIGNSGIIDVAASANFDVSAVPGYTVGASQTLKGNGSVIGSVIIAGTLSPGNSLGVLSTGSLTIGAGGTGTFDVELGRSGLTPVNDVVIVAGAVTLNSGANLQLTIGSGLTTPQLNDIFYLVNNDGTEAVTGAFTKLNGAPATLTEGSIFNWNSQQWKITYKADFGAQFTGGNDIAIQAIPEPSAWVLVGFGLLGSAFLNRWFRRS